MTYEQAQRLISDLDGITLVLFLIWAALFGIVINTYRRKDG